MQRRRYRASQTTRYSTEAAGRSWTVEQSEAIRSDARIGTQPDGWGETATLQDREIVCRRVEIEAATWYDGCRERRNESGRSWEDVGGRQVVEEKVEDEGGRTTRVKRLRASNETSEPDRRRAKRTEIKWEPGAAPDNKGKGWG
jgi:hypothetical protein